MYPYSSEIGAAASAAGVPAALLAAIAWRESGFNMAAVGDNGCSFSMFQLNVCGGAGYGYTGAQLAGDVSLACGIAARYLQQCLVAFPGDLTRGIAAYRQGIGGVIANGPINLNNYITDIQAKYQEYSGSSGGGNGSDVQVINLLPWLIAGVVVGVLLS